MSILVAIFSGLQTFLDYPAPAGRHQAAAIEYGILRREVEEALTQIGIPDHLNDIFPAVRKRWDAVDKQAPDMPQRFHDIALQIVVPERANRRA